MLHYFQPVSRTALNYGVSTDRAHWDTWQHTTANTDQDNSLSRWEWRM